MKTRMTTSHEEGDPASSTIRWPARVAAIGILASLMAGAGLRWRNTVPPPGPTSSPSGIDFTPLLVKACLIMAAIEGVFFLSTWRPPRSRVVGFLAAIVLAVAVWVLIGDVVLLVRGYLWI